MGPNQSTNQFRKTWTEFRQAATVFLDPLALTRLDDEHGETETRWVTMGRDRTNSYVLVVHTFEQLTHDRGRVRLISARRPTKAEVRNYGNPMKREYDFSKAERGKFFRPNAEISLPIYLSAEVQAYLAERAAQKGIPLSEMVDTMLQKQIQKLESAK